MVPAWLDRVAQWSWRLLATIVLVAILVGVFVAIPLVLLPIVIATIVAATVNPLVGWLTSRGWSRTRAVALAVGGGFIAIVVILLLTVFSLVSQVTGLMGAASTGADQVNAAAGGHLGFLSDAVAFSRIHVVTTVVAAGERRRQRGGHRRAERPAVLLPPARRRLPVAAGDGARATRGRARRSVRRIGRAFDVLGGYMGGTAAISFVGAFSQLVIMVVLGIDVRAAGVRAVVLPVLHPVHRRVHLDRDRVPADRRARARRATS